MSTINYLAPVVGAVPSSHAAQTANEVSAQIVMTDLDTSAVITHNFLSSQIFPPNTVSDLASGWPKVSYIFTTAPTTTLANALQIVVGTNIVTITKVAQVGSAFTGTFWVSRPQTATR